MSNPSFDFVRLRNYLAILKIKVTKVINQLVTKMDVLYKKHALPGFDDRNEDEDTIDDITDELTKVRFDC